MSSKYLSIHFFLAVILLAPLSGLLLVEADEQESLPGASINGTAPGWVILGEEDFAGVNGDPDTWTWKGEILFCKGTPIGVMRTKKVYKNFELVVQWRHLKSAGNSGVFVWAPMKALTGLEPNKLPKFGIEVQMLDHGYAEQYEKRTGKKGDWFSTNGDIFAVGNSKLKPFPPLSPNGRRSFPRKNLSKGVWGMESLLRSLHQWRSAALGQWRGSVWRQWRRTSRGPSLPGVGRLAHRIQEHSNP